MSNTSNQQECVLCQLWAGFTSRSCPIDCTSSKQTDSQLSAVKIFIGLFLVIILSGLIFLLVK